VQIFCVWYSPHNDTKCGKICGKVCNEERNPVKKWYLCPIAYLHEVSEVFMLKYNALTVEKLPPFSSIPFPSAFYS
jgi:hypothetical protein